MKSKKYVHYMFLIKCRGLGIETEIVLGLYNARYQELFFNGKLTKNNEKTLEQQLHKKLVKVLKNRYDNIK